MNEQEVMACKAKIKYIERMHVLKMAVGDALALSMEDLLQKPGSVESTMAARGHEKGGAGMGGRSCKGDLQCVV